MAIISQKISQYYKNFITEGILAKKQYVKPELLRNILETYILPPPTIPSSIPENSSPFNDFISINNASINKREIAEKIIEKIRNVLSLFWIDGIRIIKNGNSYKINVYVYWLGNDDDTRPNKIKELRKILATYFLYTYNENNNFILSETINNVTYEYKFTIKENLRGLTVKFWDKMFKFKYPQNLSDDTLENYIDIILLPMHTININNTQVKYISFHTELNKIYLLRTSLSSLGETGNFIVLNQNNPTILDNILQLYQGNLYTNNNIFVNEQYSSIKKYYTFYDYLIAKFNTILLDETETQKYNIQIQLPNNNSTITIENAFLSTTINDDNTIQHQNNTIQNSSLKTKSEIKITIPKEAIDTENISDIKGFLLNNNIPFIVYYLLDLSTSNGDNNRILNLSTLNIPSIALYCFDIPLILLKYNYSENNIRGITIDNLTDINIRFTLEI